jgi:hypothetical protein
MTAIIAMTIAASARTAIGEILAEAEQGSVPTLLIGYHYEEGVRVPSVEVSYYTPAIVEEIQGEYATHGDELLYECDGITFAVVFDSGLESLEGKILHFTDESFRLASH